jgi:hypothetical protein
VISESPGFAVAPSFSHVRFIGAPWNSMRPAQEMIAGRVSLSMPSK